VIFEPLKKIFISRHIVHQLVQTLYQCAETRSIKVFDCSLNHFRTWSRISATSEPPWEDVSTQLWTVLRHKHFPPQTGNISLWIPFALSSFAHEKRRKERRYSVVYSSSPVGILALNMRMRVCYLNCHEAWLCCYLLIHTENLLRPLELLYFQLWPIYWLSLVLCDISVQPEFFVMWYLTAVFQGCTPSYLRRLQCKNLHLISPHNFYLYTLYFQV
jgi:hypothetical protein